MAGRSIRTIRNLTATGLALQLLFCLVVCTQLEAAPTSKNSTFLTTSAAQYAGEPSNTADIIASQATRQPSATMMSSGQSDRLKSMHSVEHKHLMGFMCRQLRLQSQQIWLLVTPGNDGA
jgi:hypothetical protein